MKFKDTESIFEITGGNMKGVEVIIKCTEKACLSGLTAGFIKENTYMTKKKDGEFLFGLTARNTKASGIMENNMDKVLFLMKKEEPEKEFGKMENFKEVNKLLLMTFLVSFTK